MRKSLLSLGLASLMACGGSVMDAPSGPVNVAGTWKLRNVNGMVLPFSFPPSDGTTKTYLQSTMTIAPNGRYTEVVTETFASHAGTVGSNDKKTGRWTADGGTVTIVDQTDGVTFTASVKGLVMTAEIVPGYKQVYEFTGPVLIAPTKRGIAGRITPTVTR